jgi:hypothetical protein|uniref:Uncharacterized protein n=1 Tax=viral metagenome TaxID=1070528 RepID=A0A6C0D3U7_9ZZZZ
MGRKKNKVPKNLSFIGKIFRYFDSHVQTLNQSKIFAGLMIITLNIVSKFANFKLSKTLESYLKYTFSRQVLVFAIAWMGTRDIYIALFITFCFTIVTEHFFHEESPFFVLSEDFRDYHINLLENEGKDEVTKEDVIKAKAILEKAKKQNLSEDNDYQSYPM